MVKLVKTKFSRLFKNRKAQMQDVVTLLGIITIIIFLGFISLTILSEFRIGMVGTVNQNSLDAIDDVSDGYTVLDKFMPAFVGLLLIVVGVAASRIQTAPQFLVFSIFILGFVMFAAAGMSNAVDEFINDTTLSVQKSNLPFSVVIGRNLPKIGLAMGIVLMIGLYAKTGGGSNL